MPHEIDAVTTVAWIGLVSFAIDRIATGILFLLSFSSVWNKRFPEPLLVNDALSRFEAEKKRQLIYFVFAGVLALAVLSFPTNLRVLKALGVEPTPPTALEGANKEPDPLSFRTLDFLVTGLVLLGGAGGITRLLKVRSIAPGSDKSEKKPLEITGRITVDEEKPR